MTGERSVLITGHMGFIGSWLAYLMAISGYKVFGLDNRSSSGERLYDIAGLDQIMTRSLLADVSDYESVERFVDHTRPELVMHLAGQAIIPRAFYIHERHLSPIRWAH